MKRFGIMLALLGIIVFVDITDAQAQKDPDEQIIVNKKFDDKGNLIQYDSTYMHKWSSDSTFEFSFPDNDFFAGKVIPDMQKFFNEFFNDSSLNQPGFSQRFDFQPNFDNDEYFRHFQPFFNDSLLSQYFGLNDQFFHGFPNDSFRHLPDGFGFTDPGDLRKQLEEQFNHWHGYNFKFHEFDNPHQSLEWNELMEKHQKEIEELRKKWNDEKRNQ